MYRNNFLNWRKFRPEVPSGEKVPFGWNQFIKPYIVIQYVTLSAARQADTSSRQGESSQMLGSSVW